MCSFQSEKRLFRHDQSAKSWQGRASWLDCPLSLIRINFGMRVVITWRLRDMTPELFRIILGTRIFNTPCAIPRWRLKDLKISGMIKSG